MHVQTQTSAAFRQAVNTLRQGAFELCAANRSDEACQALDAALEIEPGQPELLGDLAALHLQAGRHAQSIDAARRALAADADHDESAYALATALTAIGQLDEARGLYRELAQGHRAERFAKGWPELAAHSHQVLQQLQARPAAAPAAPAARRAAHGLREFIWQDFDPYTRLPSQPSAGGLHGWYSDHPVFETLIRERRPRRVLEVGSLFGASAIHMARLLDQHRVDAEIVCVDTFLGSRETFFEHREARHAMLRHGRYHFLDEFLGNVSAAGVAHRVVPFVQTSTNAARILREHGAKFDLVYLDASHEYRDVIADLREWWPLVDTGGVLLGDDFEDPWYGIVRAGMEFADEIGQPIQLHRAFASSPAGGRENTKFSFVR